MYTIYVININVIDTPNDKHRGRGGGFSGILVTGKCKSSQVVSPQKSPVRLQHDPKMSTVVHTKL